MTVSVIPQYKPLIAEFKDIDKLSSSDFEIFVRDLFVASGWTDAEITQTGKTFKHGDGGVDIFQIMKKGCQSINGDHWIVIGGIETEAKRHAMFLVPEFIEKLERLK